MDGVSDWICCIKNLNWKQNKRINKQTTKKHHAYQLTHFIWSHVFPEKKNQENTKSFNNQTRTQAKLVLQPIDQSIYPSAQQASKEADITTTKKKTAADSQLS